MRRYLYISLVFILLAGLLALPFAKAQAQGSVTGADMIALMNQWRSGYYSNALIEDLSLDYCAQATADEMNRIGASGHLVAYGYPAASVRCADYGFGGGSKAFVTENWAADSRMTIDLLASYWADSDHMLPATRGDYKYIGVGISGNYYVLQAGYYSGDTGSGTSVGSVSTPSVQTTAATEDTSNYVPPIITSTPDLDGNIYHKVENGQTLFSIATYYGVGYDQIKTLNPDMGDVLYAGTNLLISKKPTPTITPTRTATVMMPSRTPTQTLMPTTPSPTKTVTPTPTPTKVSVLEKVDRQYLGLGLLVLSAAGLFVVLFFFFIRPRFKKN